MWQLRVSATDQRSGPGDRVAPLDNGRTEATLQAKDEITETQAWRLSKTLVDEGNPSA
jgi:hypothetical protein